MTATMASSTWAPAAKDEGGRSGVGHAAEYMDRAPISVKGPRACPPFLGSGQAGPRRMNGFA